MPVEARSMPGLATDDDLARLRDAEGTDFDRLFLTLMAAHHEGGVHMADYAADHAADPRVRSLAALMAQPDHRGRGVRRPPRPLQPAPKPADGTGHLPTATVRRGDRDSIPLTR